MAELIHFLPQKNAAYNSFWKKQIFVEDLQVAVSLLWIFLTFARLIFA